MRCYVQKATEICLEIISFEDLGSSKFTWVFSLSVFWYRTSQSLYSECCFVLWAFNNGNNLSVLCKLGLLNTLLLEHFGESQLSWTSAKLRVWQKCLEYGWAMLATVLNCDGGGGNSHVSQLWASGFSSLISSGILKVRGEAGSDYSKGSWGQTGEVSWQSACQALISP